ncbi:V-type ATP synthase subunit C [Pyrococcus yayanosii]|uniref:A-type ATP synthase subunit C n=1 Tax=Pyrococcus yayanosii (strain CH1 / JCM 16557) TaxID=529709 RepID=F8AGV1_PYRYC|nr:V-type ATP synthase subunit C [Pyrococcus yayanosii]AEH25238.1 V-type ATP synthase subunit C [Pyrococcus yayanosii CH1]
MDASTITTLLNTTIAVVFTWVAYKTGQMIWKYTPYSYPNARIRAMEARLLSDQRISELAESRTLSNFVVNLEDTDYRERLSGLEEKGAEDIERALELNLADLQALFIKIMPKRVKGFFELLFQEWDIRNVANVVKAKMVGEPAIDYVVPAGLLLDKVRAMAEAKTMEEMLVILEGTDYEEPLRRLLLKEIDLQEFETELYRIYYGRLLKYALSRKGEEKLILEEFVRLTIDAKNISTILRAKTASLSAEYIRRNLIPGGYLGEKTLEALANTEDAAMALGELEETRYSEVVKETREAIEKGDIGAVEKALLRFIKRRMRELSQFYPLSVAVALAYLLEREAEVRKLKAIAKLIEDGVPPEKIRELVGEVA